MINAVQLLETMVNDHRHCHVCGLVYFPVPLFDYEREDFKCKRCDAKLVELVGVGQE